MSTQGVKKSDNFVDIIHGCPRREKQGRHVRQAARQYWRLRLDLPVRDDGPSLQGEDAAGGVREAGPADGDSGHQT